MLNGIVENIKDCEAISPIFISNVCKKLSELLDSGPDNCKIYAMEKNCYKIMCVTTCEIIELDICTAAYLMRTLEEIRTGKTRVVFQWYYKSVENNNKGFSAICNLCPTTKFNTLCKESVDNSDFYTRLFTALKNIM